MARSLKRLVTALFVVAVVGCSPASSQAPAQPTTIQLLAAGDPEELAAYRAVIAGFEAKQSTVKVELVEAADRADLVTRLTTSFSGGQPPDLFLTNYRFYGQFATRDVLEPLGDRVATSSAFKETDFFEEALGAFRRDGKLICMPQNISSLVVYYNRDLFKADGISEPEDGWQFRDMIDKARALTKDTDGDGRNDQYGLGMEPSIIRLAPFLWSNDADIVDDPAKPTKLVLDTPNAIQAMNTFFQAGRARVIPTEQEQEAQGDEDRFLAGTTAMYLQSRRAVPTFRTITTFDWDVASLPIIGRPATVLHSDAYCMPKSGTNKDAAWQFLEFALGSEGETIAARTGRTVPSMKSVAASDAFLDPNAKPRNSQVFLDSIPNIRRLPNISVWPEIEKAMNQILEPAMYEAVPPDTLAAQLDAATKDIFARAQENQ